MKKTILLIAIFAFNLSLFGQIEKNSLDNYTSFSSKEKTVLKTNTDFLIAGEYVYYKLFTINKNNLSTISKIGYVELINANKEVVLSHKIKLNNGVGSGDFFIPSEVMTGMYKLIGYTNFSKNNANESYFVKDLFIVNPFTATTQKVENNLETIAKVNKKEQFVTTNVSNPLLTISTQKKQYSQRELINISINISEKIKKGNYSLSIRQLDSIKTINPNTINYISDNNSELFFIPEMRGELTSGKITNIINTPDIADKHIALSILGKNPVFKVVTTNSYGQFFFNLNENYDNPNALCQVIESNNEDFKMKLDSIVSINYDSLHFSDLQIDSKLKKTIQDRNIQNQIENVYYEKKQDSVLPSLDSELFYGKFGYKIRIRRLYTI